MGVRKSVLFYVVHMGKVPMVVRCQKANDKHEQHADQHGRIARQDPPQQRAGQRTDQRGAGVDVLDQNERQIARQHVADHAAANACQDADEDQKEGAALRIERQRVPDAHHREDAQTDGVHDQKHRIEQLLIMHQVMPQPRNKQQNGRCGGDDDAQRIAEGERRRDTENQISQNAAADGGDDAEHDHAEQVHALFHCDQRTGRGKGNRADQL